MQPWDGDLLKSLATGDVAHEVRSLARWSTTRIEPADVNRSEVGFARAANQAFAECAMLHLRAVVDFLEERSNGPTDLVASHYFDNRNDWSAPKLLTENEREDLNRHLAHLTTQRQTSRNGVDQFDWSKLHRHVPAVLGAFRVFVLALEVRDSERAEWFRGAVASIDAPWHADG